MFSTEGFAEGQVGGPPAARSTRPEYFPDDSDAEHDNTSDEGETQVPQVISDDEDAVKEESNGEDAGRPHKSLRKDDTSGHPVPSSDAHVSALDHQNSARMQIVITDFSIRTYSAMLSYLHTGAIALAPLRVEYESDDLETEANGERYDTSLAHHFHGSLALKIQPASPKSVFR